MTPGRWSFLQRRDHLCDISSRRSHLPFKMQERALCDDSQARKPLHGQAMPNEGVASRERPLRNLIVFLSGSHPSLGRHDFHSNSRSLPAHLRPETLGPDCNAPQRPGAGAMANCYAIDTILAAFDIGFHFQTLAIGRRRCSDR